MKRFLFWAPRILAILFSIFLSIFALDVFDSKNDLSQTLLALLIHLIPSIIILIALLIAWRREFPGGILFISLGIGYLYTAMSKMHWSVYLLIPLPVFIIGGLFLLHWYLVTRKRL